VYRGAPVPTILIVPRHPIRAKLDSSSVRTSNGMELDTQSMKPTKEVR
jgi:hypothetical protein